MDETLYAVLGVAPDADPETIERSYRDRVKSHHPDVSERDDADAAFRRLTTAREVLLDEDERARYDRLGHDAYVWRHLDGDDWAVSDARAPAAGRDRARAGPTTDGGRGPDSDAAASGSAGGAAGTAASYYRSGGDSGSTGETKPGSDPLDVLRAVGPWAIVHLVLLTSGLATAWLVMDYGALSIASLLLAAFLLTVVFVATVFHLSVKAAAAAG